MGGFSGGLAAPLPVRWKRDNAFGVGLSGQVAFRPPGFGDTPDILSVARPVWVALAKAVEPCERTK